MASCAWVVLKFGGTSVSTRERWETIKGICTEHLKQNKRIVIVCSALSGVSNHLQNLVDRSLDGEYESTLEKIKTAHYDFAKDLGVSTVETILEEEFRDLSSLALGLSLVKVSSPQVSAKILSFGEFLLTKLAHAWLLQSDFKTQLLDSRHFLEASQKYMTENENLNYLSASCDSDYDDSFLKTLEASSESCFLMQGFVARNHREETVLLGRGGSDVSAALIASKINAEKLEIWSDVPGLFTSNPRQIATARIIRELDYVEAREISFCGAKVLHPKCLEPLKTNDIPLELKWIDRPQYVGTKVSSARNQSSLKVKAVIAKRGVYMISMDTVDMWQKAGFLSDVFVCFKRYGLSIDLVATSQTNVTVTLDAQANSLNEKVLDDLLASLSRFCEPKRIGPCAVISLVGRSLKAFFPELGVVLEKFKEKNCYLMTQASSDLNFSFIVSEDDSQKIVEKLHSVCFGGVFKDNLLGETWHDLYVVPNEGKRLSPYKKRWWFEKKDELIDLAKKKERLYVYHKETVLSRLQSLKGLRAIKRVNFALKANHHKELISLLYQEGACFDCVSMEEILYLKELFPEIASEKILFTPNFAPIREYKEALDLGCLVTIDNLTLLEKHGSLFHGKEIFIRLDPGSGKGHHPHVKTGGKDSKFGISMAMLDRLLELTHLHGLKIIGLHAHAGSGILDPYNWVHTAKFLAGVARNFPEVKTLNLGGGFGIPDNPMQKSLDIDLLDKLLYDFSLNHKGFDLWIEPGRFLVAESGVLLMTVTQLKSKEDKKFLGVNTGMNSLIRPSLYGSYHELVNLNHLDAQAFVMADVVGPICETGDVLGHDRSIPVETEEGDIILLDNAGAYGRVMSSSYNMRAPAGEHIL